MEPDPPPAEPAESKFRLTWSNRIYFGVIAGLIIVVPLWMSNGDGTLLGAALARIAVYFAICWGIAWWVWSWSAGKIKKPSGLTFNIVLTLILLSQAAMMPGISGSQQTGPQIMAQYRREVADCVTRWDRSCQETQEPEMLDCSVLIADDEFDRQRKVLNTHVENSQARIKLMTNMIPELKRRFSVLGRDNSQVKLLIAGAREAASKTMPIFKPLMKSHVEYGRNMIAMLDFLQQHRAEWSCRNGGPIFKSNALGREFNRLAGKITKQEDEINGMARKLKELEN